MPRTSSKGLTLGQIQQMLLNTKSELKSLGKERQRLQKELARVDARISKLSGGKGSRCGRGRAKNSVSLPEAIAAVLAKASEPLRVAQIAAKVEAAGYQSNSGNFKGIISQALGKDKRFGKASRGLYQLKK